jgi:hypothetical protein
MSACVKYSYIECYFLADDIDNPVHITLFAIYFITLIILKLIKERIIARQQVPTREGTPAPGRSPNREK